MSNPAQSDFTAAIFNPNAAVPKGLSNPDGQPATKRFDVYRNNVMLSLLDALKTGFPVVAKILGKEFFQAMSLTYIRQNPPKSPLMMYFGADLPVFLEGFAPVAKLGFLPDVARLEISLRESYHAADANPVSADYFQKTAPDVLMDCRFSLAPATRLVRSRWPIYDIWQANQDPAGPEPKAGGQAVLITRMEFDPMPNLLPPGAATFVMSLAKNDTFGTAMDVTQEKVPDFDLSRTLALLLQNQALCLFEKETK